MIIWRFGHSADGRHDDPGCHDWNEMTFSRSVLLLLSNKCSSEARLKNNINDRAMWRGLVDIQWLLAANVGGMI